MTPKHPTAITVAAALVPTIAHAQTQVGSDTRLSQFFWTSLPILFVAGIIFLVLRFSVSGKKVKTYDDYRQRHMQHMERVEQTLEQIRQALERK
jgi:hypothetical protein